MHKILILPILAIFLAWSGGSFAADSPNRQVKAGIFSFDGYHMKDDDGKLEGYGIDLLELISEYSHLNFDFVGFDDSWQDMLKMLEDGEIDLVSTARRTPEREEKFLFSHPVGLNYTILKVLPGNNKIKAGKYDTYDGIVVGEVVGSSKNGLLEEFAKRKNFTYKVKSFTDPELMADALQAGEIDAILSSNLRRANNEKTIDVISTDNFFFITRKEDKDLMDEINYAIEQMNINEGDWENKLFYRYYGPSSPDKLVFTDREKNFIDDFNKSGKKITAIARGDSPPYSFVEEGELIGILPDYFTQIMALSGLNHTFVAPRDKADYQSKVDGNSIDVVLDRTMPNIMRLKDANKGFASDPYMHTGMARVTRKDFSGTVHTVALGDQTPEMENAPFLKDVKIDRYSSVKDALEAVKDGNADAAFVFPYTAQLFVNKDPDNELTFTMMNDGGSSFHMFVPENVDHELITILNKSIKHLPEGTLNQISQARTTLTAEDMSVAHYLRANPWIFVIGMIALAGGICLVAFLLARGNWNRRMLAAKEKANKELEEQLSIVEALSRDYANVLAINEETGTTRAVKIAGYVPVNLEISSQDEQPYEDIAADYINNRVHPQDRSYMTRVMSLGNITEKLANKLEYTGSYRIMENGQASYFQFNFVRLPQKDSRWGKYILLGFRNIDEMIKREREQKIRLADALAQARYANEAKTAFLNNMSHDIRTPMNAIIGFTTLAKDNVGNPSRVKDYLGKIMTSGKHLLNLINDVLDMSRIESGKVVIEETEISLPELVHEMRTITQADVKAKQLHFSIEIHNLENERILGDRLRLNQVLLNILSNAMKYTPKGGSIKIALTQLASSKDGEADFEFRVSDTGIGMSKKFLEHVFEPFEREQTSTVSGIQGTGLGLAIAKNIVEMMNGSIRAESEVGVGSEFIAIFPFKLPPQAEDLAIPAKFASAPALVVTEDTAARKNLEAIFAKLDISADYALSGQEALATARKDTGKGYGLYLVDLSLDNGSLETLKSIRQLADKNSLVIALTPTDFNDGDHDALEAGATAVFAKPLFMSDVVNLLRNPAHAVEEHATEDQDDFSGKRILLVEDNEMNQEIAQMILENAGFEVEIADNGAQAVQRLEENDANYFDLALMDVQMPVMDGYEATKRIRALADKAKANIKIIAMTANAFEEDRQQAMEAGMDGYIPKPIDINYLMATLKEILLPDPA